MIRGRSILSQPPVCFPAYSAWIGNRIVSVCVWPPQDSCMRNASIDYIITKLPLGGVPLFAIVIDGRLQGEEH